MKRLIECVPNFSEGRDAAKIDAIVAAMAAVPGVFVLDCQSDADHNRSVVTLAGEPEAVAAAALAGVGKALELIDLTKHSGEHPRIGATDVLPFVPVEGVRMEECVALAHSIGREIWARLRIPVYFYEAAAMRPERVNLENVRRGQFEGLREAARRNPERAPDVGTPRVHPTAGAIAVGARKLLIAFNINLSTPDLSVAKQIAKAIRFSGGGLPCVKALGVRLKTRRLAQVSVNLTDFERTSLHTVFQAVKREAKRHGASVVGSEIVGLVPRKALETAAASSLQLEDFSPAQVLEDRLAAALAGAAHAQAAASGSGLAHLVRPFLHEVALPAAPAGGSVSALAGALSASLGQMVAGLARERKTTAAPPEELGKVLDELRRAAEALTEAIDDDAAAYQAFLAARRLPPRAGADEQRCRDAAVQSAARRAVEAPMNIADLCVSLLEPLGQLEGIAPASMRPDLRVARFMAAAGAKGALEVVRFNLDSLADQVYARAARSRAKLLLDRLAAALRRSPE